MAACNFRYLNKKNAQKRIKNLQIRFFVLPLQSQSANGALVQLVRIRACHARGQGFESPTHREKRVRGATEYSVAFFTKVCFGFGIVIRPLGVIIIAKRLGYGVY